MIVTIANTQWACSVASTLTEITQGLSGVESMPEGEGVLFDLRTDYSRIDINMDEMLFPIDIVFINSNLTVVGVLHDVNPGDEAYFEASNSLGARCFMEVNAGEAASVNVGDIVVMQDGLPEPVIETVLAFMILIAMVTGAGYLTVKTLKSE